MQRIQLNQDIRPLSEFRANVASFIEHIHKTNRPLVITNHGKSAAVLINVEEYEAIMEKLELLEDIHQAQKEIAQGKGLTHAEVEKRMRAKFNKK